MARMHSILFSILQQGQGLRRLNGGGGAKSRPRTARSVATITAGGLARAVGPRSGRLRRGEARETCETGGRTGGRAGEWVARAAGGWAGEWAARAGGRRRRGRADVGDSARGQQRRRCTGGGSGSPTRRVFERMSIFKAAMVCWMMPVMSDSIMTAGSRPRRHDARATASSTCVGLARREHRSSCA